MIKRITLAIAAATIAGGVVAAPVAQATTSASIWQPSCWGRTVKCLVATPAASPNLKYQAQASSEWGDPPA